MPTINSKGQFVKGMTSWNKGKKMSKESRLKMSIAHKGKPTWNKGGKCPWANPPHFSGGKSSSWKGDNSKPESIHRWVNKHKTKPLNCETCNRQIKLEWSNKSHTYTRDFDDYVALCRSCHRKYDIQNNYYQLGCHKRFKANLSCI